MAGYIDAFVKLDRIADAKAVFDQARSKGAKGDGFDKLEVKLGSSVSKNLNDQEPPKEQLKFPIDLYIQGQHQKALNKSSEYWNSFLTLLIYTI